MALPNGKKISLNGEVILDLTNDTVTENKVLSGYTFHKADGTIGTGTLNKAAPNQINYIDTARTTFEPADYAAIDTSAITSMSNILSSLPNLTTVDLSTFDISNVTSMNNLFSNDTSLTSVTFSQYSNNKLTSLNNCFRNCSALTSLDLSKLDTSNSTGFSNAFSGCTNLQTLDIRNFDFSSVSVGSNGISNMFLDVPSTCVIYVNQDAYDFLETDFNATNKIALASLDMLHVVSNS